MTTARPAARVVRLLRLADLDPVLDESGALHWVPLAEIEIAEAIPLD